MPAPTAKQTTKTPPNADSILTNQRIFFFLLPLSVSFLLMTVGSPWLQAVVSRKNDAELQLAAYGIALSAAILTHAPAISLLPTSNALVRDAQSHRVVLRLTLVICVFHIIMGSLNAFSPMFDLYLNGLLGVPQEIVDAARPAMVLLIPTGATVAMRRFRQGLMIQTGKNAPIWHGTLARLIVSASLAVGLGAFTELPGAVIAVGAWSLSIWTESAYAYFASIPDARRMRSTPRDPSLAPLTMMSVLRFYAPLAMTTLFGIALRPVIEAGLAGTADAETALAAWPIMFTLIIITRSAAEALPSTIVSLNSNSANEEALRRFSYHLALGLGLFASVIAFTPLTRIYVDTIVGAPESVHQPIMDGMRMAVLLPVLLVFSHYHRGVLMVRKRTQFIYVAMLISLVTVVTVMFGGSRLGLPGIPLAVLAMTAGDALSFIYLGWVTSHQSQVFPLEAAQMSRQPAQKKQAQPVPARVTSRRNIA